MFQIVSLKKSAIGKKFQKVALKAATSEIVLSNIGIKKGAVGNSAFKYWHKKGCFCK